MQGGGEEARGVSRHVRQGVWQEVGGMHSWGRQEAGVRGSQAWGGLPSEGADEEVSFQAWSRGCARASLGAGANVWRLRKDWRERSYTADVQGPGHPTLRSPAALRPGGLRGRGPRCSGENGSGSAFF